MASDEAMKKDELRPSKFRNVPPCPKCGAEYPIVQCQRLGGEMFATCTHCAITGKLGPPRQPSEEAMKLANEFYETSFDSLSGNETVRNLAEFADAQFNAGVEAGAAAMNKQRDDIDGYLDPSYVVERVARDIKRGVSHE